MLNFTQRHSKSSSAFSSSKMPASVSFHRMDSNADPVFPDYTHPMDLTPLSHQDARTSTSGSPASMSVAHVPEPHHNLPRSVAAPASHFIFLFLCKFSCKRCITSPRIMIASQAISIALTVHACQVLPCH